MLQNAMFPVKEVPIFKDVVTHNLGTHDKNGRSGYKFIVREDTGQILSCMTDDYKLVKNETLLKTAEPLIKANGGKIKEVRVFGDGQKLHTSWSFPKNLVKIGKNDEMTPEIVIGNSYDGTLGVNIIAGAFRLICSNGAIIGVVVSKYKNKHIKANVSLDDIGDIVSETVEKTKLVMKDEFPVLIDTDYKDKHIVEFLKMFPIQANEMVTQALIANKPKSFWDLFNVGTNVLSHHMNRDSQSTHLIEGKLYPTIKRWASKEAKVALA